jgi:hypothetical protein
VEWTISGYLIGFSLDQLFRGPIGDRHGHQILCRLHEDEELIFRSKTLPLLCAALMTIVQRVV